MEALVSQVEWCLERGKVFNNAAALEDDPLRKALLLGLAEQWTLASTVAADSVARRPRLSDDLRGS
jgi:hypothetical protein